MAANLIDARYEVLEAVPGLDAPHVTAYKARDVQAGRVMLLRSFAVDDPGQLDVKQLAEKAAAAARIEHNHIAPTLDVGPLDAGNGVYLVSEYARGITLQERIRRVAPFSLVVAVDIGMAVAEALAAAHERQFPHGGLTPSNVQLTPEGQIRVLEFGIAADLSAAVGRQQCYLPPAEPPVSLSADVYAWGAIMHEMLTGQAPTPLEQRRPLSPRVLNAGVPTALEGIVGRAGDPDATRRYLDADALLADLHVLRDAMRSGKPLTWLPVAQPVAAGTAAHAADGGSMTQAAADLDADAYDDDIEPPNPLGNALKVLFIVVILGVIGLTWYAFRLMSVPGDLVVPRLVGKTLDEAERLAGQQGFRLVSEQDYSDQWPENQIYQQDPESGHTIKAGRSVTVYVSRGSRYVLLPNVVGQTQDQAIALLKDANLGQPEVIEQYDQKVPLGLVISEVPAPKTKIERDTTVQLSVSLGKEPPDPPDGVTAEPTNIDQVQITWQPAARATYYLVTRIVDTQSTVIASKLYTTSFMDTGLKPGSSYSYTVTAVNSVGESEPSDPALAVTPTVSPISSLVPGGHSSGDTNGSATDNGDNSGIKRRQFEVSFRVPRKVPNQRHVQIEVVDLTGTTLVYDHMLDPGTMVDETETGFGDKITFQIYLDGQVVKQRVL